jgi:ABC-type branched-subunit amino acid transport system substrate-binding protein
MAFHLRKAGFSGSLAGPAPLQSASFLQAAGPSAEGVVIVSIASAIATASISAQFVEDYKRAYSCEPDFTAFMAHDAALLSAHIAGESGEQVLYRKFPISGTVEGVSGPLRFDVRGNRIVALTMRVCHGGKFADLADVRAATSRVLQTQKNSHEP